MSRDKQIEEMANTYKEARYKANETIGSMNEGAEKWYAKAFYNAGYRKASEVVEEIFAEMVKIVEKEIRRCDCFRDKEKDEYERTYWEGGRHSLQQARYQLAELKKKYTEDGV